MPEHEDLNLLGPVTSRKQDQELKDTTEDEVRDRPGHEQRGCPLHEGARAMDLQLNSTDPGFRTPQATDPPSVDAFARQVSLAGVMGYPSITLDVRGR